MPSIFNLYSRSGQGFFDLLNEFFLPESGAYHISSSSNSMILCRFSKVTTCEELTLLVHSVINIVVGAVLVNMFLNASLITLFFFISQCGGTNQR